MSELKMSHALTGPSLNAIARDHGKPMAIMWIGDEVRRAARLCGGMDLEVVAECAEMIFDRFRFRTANALRLALRDGMNAGKIFGKLTYPVIAEWLTAHEEAVISDSDNAHDATK